MLFLLLLLLPLLLLLLFPPPPWAAFRQKSPRDARLPWLVGLQHRAALGLLCWAAAWQRRRLEQSTLQAGLSQRRALRRCLRAQGPRRPRGASAGGSPGSAGVGRAREKEAPPEPRIPNLKYRLPVCRPRRLTGDTRTQNC